MPRNVDKPANRIEDIHGMADFISQYPGVDSTRIGLLGICGGGGYSLAAAETDKRFKSIATIPKHIQKREGYSAIKALAAVNNAIIQLMVYGVPSLNRG